MFIQSLVDGLYPEVGDAMVRILSGLGATDIVTIPGKDLMPSCEEIAASRK